jgi:hypothetical protein
MDLNNANLGTIVGCVFVECHEAWLMRLDELAQSSSSHLAIEFIVSPPFVTTPLPVCATRRFGVCQFSAIALRHEGAQRPWSLLM